LELELALVDLLADQEGRLAGLGDLDLLQHLTRDRLDVLVVDLHALQAIDLLDLVDEILGQLLDAQHAQDVVRHGVAVDQEVAALDVVAFLDGDALGLRDQVLDRLRTLAFRHDQDAALALVVLAELDAARDVADDREVLGLARLEQLGHARQTARDVAVLAALARDTREDVAGMDLLAILDRKHRVERQQIAGLLAVGEHDRLALAIVDGDARTQVAAARLALPVDDDAVGNARGIVDHLAHRHAFDQVDIDRLARLLGDDRQGVGVPFGHLLALVDRRVVVDQQARAVGHAMLGPLALGAV